MNAFDGKVIGCEEQVTELLRVADIIKHQAYYKKLGAKIPRNIMLAGEVGLGKSLCAECFLKETERKSYILRRDGEDFIKAVSATFEEAVNHQPSVVLCDDLDHWQKDEDDTEPFTVLQAAIDKVKDFDVFIIATVNNERALPKSLRRKGRFDITLTYEAPEGKALEKIICHYLKDKNIAEDVNFSDICKMISGGMSCADTEALLNYAAILAGYERKERIEMQHFVSAILQNRYNYYGALGECDAMERQKVATHEAAHIVVGEVLQPNCVGFASLLIRQHGGGRNGVTHLCSSIERRCHKIMVDLAGKAAVELKYPRLSSGCSSDLSDAVEALSDGMTSNATYGLSLVDCSGNICENPSQDYLQKTEAVIAAELERYMQLTRGVILGNMDFLDKLTDYLLEHNTILHSDIQAIKATCKIVDGVG